MQVEDAIVSERSAVNEFKRAKWSWASTRVSGCDAKFLQSFDGLQVWGYGEEMTSHSLDTYQLPGAPVADAPMQDAVMQNPPQEGEPPAPENPNFPTARSCSQGLRGFVVMWLKTHWLIMHRLAENFLPVPPGS